MVVLFINAPDGLGGISAVSQISATASSFSSGGAGDFFLRVLDRFLVDGPSGFGLKLFEGIAGDYDTSLTTMNFSGRITTVCMRIVVVMVSQLRILQLYQYWKSK